MYKHRYLENKQRIRKQFVFAFCWCILETRPSQILANLIRTEKIIRC